MEILSFDVVGRYFCIFQKECLSLPQIHAYFHYFLSVREEVYDSQNFFVGLKLLQPEITGILVIRYTYSLTQNLITYFSKPRNAILHMEFTYHD